MIYPFEALPTAPEVRISFVLWQDVRHRSQAEENRLAYSCYRRTIHSEPGLQKRVLSRVARNERRGILSGHTGTIAVRVTRSRLTDFCM